MIRLWTARHEAEKALNLWERLKIIGFIEWAEPYNAIIFALASRPEYSRQAIDFYRTMQKKRIVPDYHTFTAVLKATSQYGDIPVACEVLDTMRNLGFEMTPQTYNGLIRTYAGAWKIPNVQESHIESYVKDAWALLDQMKEKDIPLNIQLLNSMILLHKNAVYVQELHDQVLPLFEKHKIKPDIHTYQYLIELYSIMSDTDLAIETYDRIISLGFKPNPGIMRVYLFEAINTSDTSRIVDALENYIGSKYEPPAKAIQQLMKMRNPPDHLFVTLKKFPKQYGKYRSQFREFSPPSFMVRDGQREFNPGKSSTKPRKLRKRGF